MAQNIFRLVLTDEAQNFIESLPEAVSYKGATDKPCGEGVRTLTQNCC